MGGKALQLGALVRADLPVPPGFCITTDAFRHGMDAGLAAEITAAYQKLGAGRVAVRSSATAEDLPDASFAGQQDTFLNVVGADAVVAAVEACWKSLYTERAIAYRRDHSIPEDDAAMAVVVQQMVDAEAAGVMFTLNPITGALDELVIEAARGLGDAVVSARVNPDRFRLRRRAPHEVIETVGNTTAGVLDVVRLVEIARLGLAAERLLGRAADIEWAVAGGRAYLLQSRAVTAAGPRRPVVRYGSNWNEDRCRDRLTFWANHNVRETMPYPHTPFSWSFWNYLVFPAMGAAMGLWSAEEKANPETAPHIMDLVDGRVYWNLNVMTGILGHMANPRIGRMLDAEVADIVAELMRTGQLQPLTRPFSFRRVLNSWSAPGGLRNVLGNITAERAWADLRSVQDEVAAFSKIDLRILNEEQVLALCRYFASESLPRGMTAMAAAIMALPVLALLNWRLPRWGFAEELPRLLSGLQGNPTMDTALALWDVAASAGPEVRAVFTSCAIADVPAALRDLPAASGFLGRLDEFLKQHGHRAVREFDFACPRWREDPSFIYETIRNYLAHPVGDLTPRQHYDRQVREHDEARDRVEKALARRPLRRWLFRRMIRAIETRLHLREAPKFYVLMGMAHLRDLYIEVGRRMVARGLLEKPDDFFFLSIPEIERVSAGKLDRAWVNAEIPKRRLEFAKHMRANPPLVVRSDGQPVIHAKAAAADGDVLRGVPASAGIARGPARILMDPGDGALLHKGEILVAPFTDPGWTPLFLTAGGLVMEIGGMMSHGAVTAREYGLPAAVGVRNATRVLKDGELIEVNGATGEVRRVLG